MNEGEESENQENEEEETKKPLPSPVRNKKESDTLLPVKDYPEGK